ncbi:MAG: hypothetical protein RL326_1057, partial [Pseudomonadota bacterium]
MQSEKARRRVFCGILSTFSREDEVSSVGSQQQQRRILLRTLRWLGRFPTTCRDNITPKQDKASAYDDGARELCAIKEK